MNTQHTPGSAELAALLATLHATVDTITEENREMQDRLAMLRAQVDRMRQDGQTMTQELAETQTLRQRVQELDGALEDVFGLMDQEWLVRNIEHDSEPGFAVRQLEPTMKLAKARAALERGAK